MQELGSQIVSQYEQLKGDKSGFDQQYEDISVYGLGRRDFYKTPLSTQGRKKNLKIYDNTFQNAADALAAHIQSMVVPAGTQWFTATTEDPAALQDEDTVNWLQRQTKLLYSVFNHPEGGFGPSNYEMLLDYVSFGTGAYYVGDVPGEGIFFNARPLDETHFTIGPEGKVDSVYRAYSMTARQAVEKFGMELVGEKITASFKADNLTDTFEFVQAVGPRRSFHMAGFDSRRFPLASFDVAVADKRVVRESGFPEMPWQIARWSVDAGETYGRGPGNQALPTAKVLNRMQRSKLIAAEKAAEPTILISDDGVVGTPRVNQPNGITVYKNSPGQTGPPVSFLESRARMDIADATIAQHQADIRAFFQHEVLESFNDPRMTATQVLQLSSLTSQRIGPALYRLQVQWLEPMIERVFGLLKRANMVEDPPPAIAGQTIKIDYVSPATKAQQNTDIQAVTGTMGAAMEWSQVFPDVVDNVDPDKALKVLHDAMPGGLDILRGGKAVRALRDAKNAAAQAQAEAAQAQQGVDAIAKLAPVLEGGGAQA